MISPEPSHHWEFEQKPFPKGPQPLRRPRHVPMRKGTLKRIMPEHQEARTVAALTEKFEHLAKSVTQAGSDVKEVREDISDNATSIALLLEHRADSTRTLEKLVEVVQTGNGRESLVAQTAGLRADLGHVGDAVREAAAAAQHHEAAREVDRKKQEAERRTARRTFWVLVAGWILTTVTELVFTKIS